MGGEKQRCDQHIGGNWYGCNSKIGKKDNGLGQSGTSEGGEKFSESRFILKGELIRFVDKLGKECKQK